MCEKNKPVNPLLRLIDEIKKEAYNEHITYIKMDQELQGLITQTPLLTQIDKNFLLAIGPSMSALDKLKLKQALTAGLTANIQQFVTTFKQKFEQGDQQNQAANSDGLLSRFIPQQQPEKRILSQSILTQPNILGANPPQAVNDANIPPLNSLSQFSHPSQLALLQPTHVTFDLNQNAEQNIQLFLQKMDTVMHNIEDIRIRRNYFMNFMKSPLFSAYLNTGLTALRHPELEPAKIILNLLYQINPNYLTNKQFQYAAVISNHLRGLCAL